LSVTSASSAAPAGTASEMDDSALDWLIVVTLMPRPASAPNARAATPGTPAMPLPSRDRRAWPGMALMALTGCDPGVKRPSTSVPGASGR